jgi:hypothetical protein
MFAPNCSRSGNPLQELQVGKDMDWSKTGVYKLDVNSTGGPVDKRQVQRQVHRPQDLPKVDDLRAPY